MQESLILKHVHDFPEISYNLRLLGASRRCLTISDSAVDQTEGGHEVIPQALFLNLIQYIYYINVAHVTYNM